MRDLVLWLASMIITVSTDVGAASLKVARVSPPGRVPEDTIVGHATCGGSSWLLTDANQLVEVHGNADAVTRAVLGFQVGDRPWGLACLSDGTLWTMAAPRALARLDRTGRVQERVSVQLPRIALFGAGERLLFQQLPIAFGAAALMTSPPRRPASVRPWPGLTSRTARTREEQLAQNLATCGIARETSVPCWFIDEMEFTISDGSAARAIKLPSVEMPMLDREMPVRDVALAPEGRFWYLVGGRDPEHGRRAGVRLVRGHEQSFEQLSIDLRPSARVLLSATASRCLLVAMDGSLVEIAVTP